MSVCTVKITGSQKPSNASSDARLPHIAKTLNNWLLLKQRPITVPLANFINPNSCSGTSHRESASVGLNAQKHSATAQGVADALITDKV